MTTGLGSYDAARQRTIRSEIDCSGIGLHSGVRVRMALRPAPVNTGIVFRRTDLFGADGIIHARWDAVVDTRLCTCLGNEAGARVNTVEHLMSALAGLGIANLFIDIDGPEVPAMDGSAAPFLRLLQFAGVVEQEAPRAAIRILRQVTFTGKDGASATLTPAYDGLTVEFEIDFDDPSIRHQSCSVALTEHDYAAEVSRARTFGFLQDVERMQAAGLALGGSLDNAIVIDHGRVLNDEGLRFGDECVRHKVLDAIGDLALAGGPIIGHFRGVRSGHAHTNGLLRALFDDPRAWVEVSATDAVAGLARWHPAAALASA